MNDRNLRRRAWLWLAVPVAAGLFALGPRRAAGGSDTIAEAPSGAFAFFDQADGTCPPGWRVATEAAGRLMVGVSAGDYVGRVVGTPLANQEDRTHVHGYSATVELPYKSIAGADGSNNQGAAADTYMVSGTTEPASTGLPFVQVTACVKL